MSSRRIPLQRPKPFRDAFLCVVITEGARTEPSYFQALLDNQVVDARRVSLVIVPPNENASAPKHLLASLRERTQPPNFTPGLDRAWIVSDTDRWPHPALLHMITEVSHDQHEVAISAPCFEVWLLLHFEGADLSAAQSSGRAKEALSAKMASQGQSPKDFSWVTREHLRAAVDSAANLDTDTDAPIPSHPCTRVYRLMEALPLTGGPLRATP
jgi:hypothetical protein